MAGFHKHIDPNTKIDDDNALENEIMGAVRMTDYDELTKHYTDVHKKDINENVVKDKYQDATPGEDEDHGS